MLGRLANVDQSRYTASGFSDVQAGQWYSAYIAWAAQKGIVSGYGNGTFGADDLITREQMAAMLARYSQVMGITIPSVFGTPVSFADGAEISDWAKQPVQLMQAEGLIQGVGSNQFAPKKTATRAEVASVLMRFIKAMI